MRGLVSSVLLLCLALSAARAEAQSGAIAGWSPGEPTTSRLPGEVGEPAEPSKSDGVYGRFDGDLDLGVGAGVEADGDDARGALRASLHYFSMLGLYGGYADALDDGAPKLRRLAAVGVDVRPAFVPRWSKNMERGPGFVDLTVDSISIGLGAFWAAPRGGSFGDTRGLELSGGLGLPLFGRANGLWLEARGLVRWVDPAASPGERPHGAALALLSWHELVLTGLAKD